MAFVSKKGGNFWEPRKDEKGAEKTQAGPNDILDGFFLGMEENQGKDKNSRLYTILPKEGDARSLWGTALLDEQMNKIPLGGFVRIQWLGKKQPKTAAGRPFHDWEVFHDVDIPLHASVSQKSSPQNVAVATENTVAATGAGASKDESDLPF